MKKRDDTKYVMAPSKCIVLDGASAGALPAGSLVAWAQAKSSARYDVGATDMEFRLGHFCSCTGPSVEYGVISKAHEAFWTSVNDAVSSRLPSEVGNAILSGHVGSPRNAWEQG